MSPDGTYERVTAGVADAGRFTMTVEGGSDVVQFLDPDDPSGMSTTLQMPVKIVDDGEKGVVPIDVTVGRDAQGAKDRVIIGKEDQPQEQASEDKGHK